MKLFPKILVSGLIVLILGSLSQAQTQSSAPGDRAVSEKITQALAAAGIDSRTTSVKVTTTSEHEVYLTGLIRNKDTIKMARDVAAKTAPSFRIINQIHFSFFDDPNHVAGDKTK